MTKKAASSTHAGMSGSTHPQALLAAEGLLEVQRDAGHRDGERQRRAGQVGPVQPGRGEPDERRRRPGSTSDRGEDDQRAAAAAASRSGSSRAVV